MSLERLNSLRDSKDLPGTFGCSKELNMVEKHRENKQKEPQDGFGRLIGQPQCL